MTGTADHSNPLQVSEAVYSDDIAQALYDAAEDKDDWQAREYFGRI